VVSLRTTTLSTSHLGAIPLLSCPILTVLSSPRFLDYNNTKIRDYRHPLHTLERYKVY